MIEATFPLLGTAFVVLIVLPAFALVAKAGLVLLERDAVGGPLHGLSLRYVLLTGSSVLPLAWLLSAGLHQAETGKEPHVHAGEEVEDFRDQHRLMHRSARRNRAG